jgi:serine/threonine-protein kinase
VTPFDAHRPLPEIIAAVLEEQPRSLAELAPALPDGLEAVVLRCLEKDPANRYQNAAELALALLPFAPRRARTQVERALAVTRAAGLLSDPNQSLPPSIAPAPSGKAVAIAAALDARTSAVPSVTPHPHATTEPAPPSEETAPTERAPAMPPEGATTIAPVSQEGGRRRPALWFTAGLVGVVGVAVAVLLLGRDRPAPPPPVTAPATAEAQPPALPATTATVPDSPTPASSASGGVPRPSARPRRTDPQPPVSAQRPPPAPSQGPELDIRRNR